MSVGDIRTRWGNGFGIRIRSRIHWDDLMSEIAPAPLFELFWENSKLNLANIQGFLGRINEYYAIERSGGTLERAGRDYKLPLPRDPLFRVMCGRHSERRWGSKTVTVGQLGSLFAAFARSGDSRRVFPSAGATYALEIFALLKEVERPLSGKIVYYNSDNHSLAVVGDIPPDEEFRRLINLELDGPIPPLFFVFVLIADRTTAKYGERGGRFALLEAGQAIQNLALRLVHEGMAGVEVGGLLDDRMLALLKIDPEIGIKVALGFACGPTASSGRWRVLRGG
jgi:SagB-type dehydrogenase family enzyme